APAGGAALFVDSATVLVAQLAQSQRGAALCRLSHSFRGSACTESSSEPAAAIGPLVVAALFSTVVSNHGTPTVPAGQPVSCPRRQLGVRPPRCPGNPCSGTSCRTTPP